MPVTGEELEEEASCGLGLGGASNRHRTGTDRLVVFVIRIGVLQYTDQIHPSFPLPLSKYSMESVICAREAGTNACNY